MAARAVAAERRRLAKSSGEQLSKMTRRDAEIGRELEWLIDAVTSGVDLATLVPRIKVLEKEREEVKARLAQAASSAEIVALHPAASNMPPTSAGLPISRRHMRTSPSRPN
jgi:site-specific DNA recombinase